MGGSVQVENQFSYDNIDENANDQSKHQLDLEIGTENPKGQESECKDGGDTSINVPGDNVRMDVISPQEGASYRKKELKCVVCRRLLSVVRCLYLLSSHVSTLVHRISNVIFLLTIILRIRYFIIMRLAEDKNTYILLSFSFNP
jgi:hypothetical protein